MISRVKKLTVAEWLGEGFSVIHRVCVVFWVELVGGRGVGERQWGGNWHSGRGL